MITLNEAVSCRHSVRQFVDRPIEDETARQLGDFIEQLNTESGLHMQLVTNEPKAFNSFLAHYGKFRGVKNYVALVGAKTDNLQQKCGYFGQKIVLKAQQLGLNSCWVALTYKKVKTAFSVAKGEKLVIVIALGYGETQGSAHHTKDPHELFEGDYQSTPQWFKNGMEAAMLAPTAMNQQKFKFALNGNKVEVRSLGGVYTDIDLGIVKCNFEIGAGRENFVW